MLPFPVNLFIGALIGCRSNSRMRRKNKDFQSLKKFCVKLSKGSRGEKTFSETHPGKANISQVYHNLVISGLNAHRRTMNIQH